MTGVYVTIAIVVLSIGGTALMVWLNARDYDKLLDSAHLVLRPQKSYLGSHAEVVRRVVLEWYYRTDKEPSRPTVVVFFSLEVVGERGERLSGQTETRIRRKWVLFGSKTYVVRVRRQGAVQNARVLAHELGAHVWSHYHSQGWNREHNNEQATRMEEGLKSVAYNV